MYLSKRIDKFVEQINGIFEIRYYPYYEFYNADNGFCFAHLYQEIELENQFGFNVRSVKNVNSWTTTALASYNFQKKFQTKSSLKLGVGVTAGWYPVITFNNGGKEIKWNGNFRTGWMQNANLTLVDFNYWMINGEVSAYKEIRNFMDLSAHVYYRFSNYSDSSSLNLSSNNLRGMKDNNSIFNDQTIPSFAAINFDLMTRVFRFKDYFSLYLSPFIDTGIFISKKNSQFHISVGGEGMIIFDEWPGFPMRVSYGFNIQNPSEYELTCTSSFFY